MRLLTSLLLQKKRKAFVVRRVIGSSMLPTLKEQQLIFATGFKNIRPGALVIADHKGKEIIKRVHSIEDDRIFLLGDNPKQSSDGRHFGWKQLDDVIGVVIGY